MAQQYSRRPFSRIVKIVIMYGTFSGPDAGGYYHPFFLRGMLSLAKNIPRISIKGKGHRKAVTESAPNFYDVPHLPDAKAATLPSSMAESGSPNSSLALRGVADATSLQMQIRRLQSELGTSTIPPSSLLPASTMRSLNGESGQNLATAVLTESVLRADKARFMEHLNRHRVTGQHGIGVPDNSLGYVELILAASRRRQAAILSSSLSLLAVYDQYPILIAGDGVAESMDFLRRYNGHC
jgi:hypothetical protein